MSLRIRFQYPTGSRLGYSIERLSDGSFYDFSTSSFVAMPATPISSLPEDSGNFLGRYKLTLISTPASQFTDGDYAVTVHDQGAANNVVAELGVTMHAGDDATVIPQPGSTVVDPWTVSLPGSYISGSAGAILGTNLDAHVSTRSTYAGGPVASVTAPVTVGTNNDKSGYAVSSTGLNAIQLPSGITATQALQNLDAAVSTRSTYAGGPVASVTAPVTVGTNNDKSGYALSSSGLDTIQIESGINARQALSPILAACAGIVAGAGTGVVVIKGGNSSTTRITATTDNAGNRSSVTLTLPS
jgi:hypothetical protein